MNSVYVSGNRFTISSDTIRGILSAPSDAKWDQKYSINEISIAFDVHVSLYVTPKIRIVDIFWKNILVGTSTIKYAEIHNVAGFTSGLQVINYGSSSVAHVIGALGPLVGYIVLPETKSREVKIGDFHKHIGLGELDNRKRISDSVFGSLFSNINRAYRPYMRQMINFGMENIDLKSPFAMFKSIVSVEKSWTNISQVKYNDIISIPYQEKSFINQKIYPISTGNTKRKDLLCIENASILSQTALFSIETPDYGTYFPVTIEIRHHNIPSYSVACVATARGVYIDTILSEKMEFSRVSSFIPEMIYDIGVSIGDSERDTIQEMIFPFADLIGAHNIPVLLTDFGKLNVLTRKIVDIPQYISCDISLSYLNNKEVTNIDFGFIATLFLTIGNRVDVVEQGLFSDMYVDSDGRFVGHQMILGTSRAFKLNDYRFFGISNDRVLNVFRLSGGLVNYIDCKWRAISVQNTKIKLMAKKAIPYIRIHNEDRSVIISNSTIINIEVGGKKVDSYDAKIYAGIISSMRYKKSAEILISHTLYSDIEVYDAYTYLKKYTKYSQFFTDLNPLALYGLIHKKKGINLPLFQNNSRHYYDDIEFIYDNRDLDLDYSMCRVVSDRYIKISSTMIPIHIKRDVFLLSPVKVIGTIEPCAEKCNKFRIATEISARILIGTRAVSKISTPMISSKSSRGSIGLLSGIVDIPATAIKIVLLGAKQFSGVSMSGSLSFDNGDTILVEPVHGSTKYGLDTIPLIYSKESNLRVLDLDATILGVSIEILVSVKSADDTLIVDPVYGLCSFGDWKFATQEIKQDAVWLKLFTSSTAIDASVEARFMDFNISEKEYSQGFSFPYIYVDDYVEGIADREYKSANRDVSEIKSKDFEDIVSTSPTVEKKTDLVCGPNKNMTYLEYQSCDHKFTKNEIYGMMSRETKEAIMSPYTTIVTHDIIAPGRKLDDVDAFTRTLEEIKISMVGNMPVVLDWNIEDFIINADDFGLSADNASMLSGIDSQFRGLLKAVTETLGDEVINQESLTEKKFFSEYPDRPSSKNDLADIKVEQYFIVNENSI